MIRPLDSPAATRTAPLRPQASTRLRFAALLTAVATAVALLPAADAGATDDQQQAQQPRDGSRDQATQPDVASVHGDRGLVDGAVPGEPVPAPTEPDLGTPAPPAADTDDTAGELTTDAFTTAEDHDGFPFRTSVRTTGKITPEVLIRGRGWGHGVGLSQYGAFAQALEGRTATEILTHYYPGTQVTTDTRATDNRIRAGMQINQRASNIRAMDADVGWRICTPSSDPVRNGRVPHANCLDWRTQPAGAQYRVLPLPAQGVITTTGTQTTRAGELVTIDTDDEVVGDGSGPSGDSDPTTNGTTTRIPAPRGGILIERNTGGSWQPFAAYRTPTTGTLAANQLPVARANHGSNRIEAQSATSLERVYRYGWRDYHLTGTPDAPDTHRLAVVQDVQTIEQYLRGLAEVPNSWPSASLQAQAVAGRTFALRGSRGGGCFCDKLSTPADQVFIGESKVLADQGQRWADAVTATANRVLTFDGRLAETFYSSSHGGRTENVEDSWAYGTTRIDYLRSQDDPWSLMEQVNGVTIPNSRRSWVAGADNRVMATFLSAGQPDPIVRVERIEVVNRTDGGTPRELRVTGATNSDERISFNTRLESQYAKGIAGGAMRRSLPLTSGGEAANGRISSSQITRFGFGPFTDDDASTHEYAISWAAAAGIVQGVSETRFEPGQPVTRAQMATFLNNTFALPSAPTDTASFPDVPVGSTHHSAIEAIRAAGITTGYDDGTYRPGDPVTRAEMAAFLSRALALETDDIDTFTDVRSASVHARAIEAVAASGITRGCTATTFCPQNPVNRGQLASFMERAVNG